MSQLLISRDSNKKRDKPGEDLALLQQIREANSAAAEQFLEHLVLQKRSTVRHAVRASCQQISYRLQQDSNLHMQLAMACVDELLLSLTDESVSKLWRAKGRPAFIL
jgi:hypothetical protein